MLFYQPLVLKTEQHHIIHRNGFTFTDTFGFLTEDQIGFNIFLFVKSNYRASHFLPPLCM